MDINKQVCSLELSKRLKELGIKQKSLFSWLHYQGGGLDSWYVALTDDEHLIELPEYSAFTVAELGEMLPTQIGSKCIFTDRFYNEWLVGYAELYEDDRPFMQTEADARAMCLIYLLENKQITL